MRKDKELENNEMVITTKNFYLNKRGDLSPTIDFKGKKYASQNDLYQPNNGVKLFSDYLLKWRIT